MSQQYPQQPPRHGYSQQDYPPRNMQPNVQPHIPPQFRDRQSAPQWKPPEVAQYTYPGYQAQQIRRPKYPSHLTQFPAELVGFSGTRKRGRGPSFFQMLYLGTHPIALLMSVFLILFGIELWMMWLAFVLVMWLAWCGIVTFAWGCQVGWSALRGGRGPV